MRNMLWVFFFTTWFKLAYHVSLISPRSRSAFVAMLTSIHSQMKNIIDAHDKDK